MPLLSRLVFDDTAERSRLTPEDLQAVRQDLISVDDFALASVDAVAELLAAVAASDQEVAPSALHDAAYLIGELVAVHRATQSLQAEAHRQVVTVLPAGAGRSVN